MDNHQGHDNDPANHQNHADSDQQQDHRGSHGQHEKADREHHADHTGHEEMFRKRFWICLVLSIPVLIYSPTLQDWLGFSPSEFPGSEWITPVFSMIVFVYGGLPFLRMAVPEVQDRQPGMMAFHRKRVIRW